MTIDSTDRRDFVVKINGEESGAVGATGSSSNAVGGNIWKDSSYDFWDGEKGKKKTIRKSHDSIGAGEDEGSFNFTRRRELQRGDSYSPSRLIDQFIQNQKSCGDISLDVELQSNTTQPLGGLPSISESSSPLIHAERRRSTDAVRKRPNSVTLSPANHYNTDDEYGKNSGEGEVVKCSANKSILTKNRSVIRPKPKSRLLDPPTPTHDKAETKAGKKSGILSGFMKSPRAGTPNRAGIIEEEEEEDPFSDEDLPEEFKRDKLGIWVLLEWISLILLIAGLVCSLTIPYLKRKTMWRLDLWKWGLMVLVLMCGRLVSSWIVRILVFFVESNFILRKKVLYFVYGVRKAVYNSIWLVLVLIAWQCLFDKKVKRETKSTVLRYVTKILVCLLVAVIIWLIKTLLVKVLASSFHMSTYFDRIQESLFTQYVIETLSGPPYIEINRIEEEHQELCEEVKGFEEAGAVIPPDLIKAALPKAVTLQKSPMKVGKSPGLSRVGSIKEVDGERLRIDHLQRMNTKNVSAWKMKRLMNIIRQGAITTLDQQCQDTIPEEESTQIRSEYEAKIAARKIFHNVTEPGSRFIYLDDFLRFLSEEEAERAMGLFEGASDSHRISKSCLKNWVVNAFRERRALALTLNDTKTAVNRLHRIINVLVSIIIIIIWSLILEIATTKFLLVLSSQLLLVAFIFGNSCKTIFEAIIFLFVMHPFDVGDRCEIDGIQLVVEEMNILTTVFLRYDNLKIIYPNSVLGTKPISNYYRSPDMGDAVEFLIHIATPQEKINAVKQRILNYVENKKDHWYPAPMFVYMDMDSLQSVKIAVWLSHRMNHQDMGERYIRRGQLVEEVSKTCRELDIDFRLYPLDVKIRSVPAVTPPLTSDRLPPAWVQQHPAP